MSDQHYDSGDEIDRQGELGLDGEPEFDPYAYDAAEYEKPQYAEQFADPADERVAHLEAQVAEMHREREAEALIGQYPELNDEHAALELVQTAARLAERLGHPEAADNPAWWKTVHEARRQAGLVGRDAGDAIIAGLWDGERRGRNVLRSSARPRHGRFRWRTIPCMERRSERYVRGDCWVSRKDHERSPLDWMSTCQLLRRDRRRKCGCEGVLAEGGARGTTSGRAHADPRPQQRACLGAGG
jgi:hypothetical protein